MHSNESELFNSIQRRIENTNSRINCSQETEHRSDSAPAFLVCCMELLIKAEVDGFVVLQQHDPDDGMMHISLSPDQIDQVIEWLKQAKSEAVK